MGRYFVQIAKDAGYETTLLRLGRNLRDFFNNLDNLHDYLKVKYETELLLADRIILQYTFPKMKAPSFFVDSETPESLQLQYRTRRRGFHFYVQGQVKEIAKMIFQNSGDMTNKLDAKLKKQEIVFDTAVFHFELTFDNKAYTQHLNLIENRRVTADKCSVFNTACGRKEASMPIRASIFFEMFPFCILFEVNFQYI